MNSYDIVGKAVQEYWKETYPQDVVAFFYQKYDYQSDDHWEQCEELVFPVGYNNYEDMEFETDFCEGQTDVKDLRIVALDHILNHFRRFCIDT